MELTSNDPAINFTQFILGSLTFEWLIAEYGFDAYKKLIYLSGVSMALNLDVEAMPVDKCHCTIHLCARITMMVNGYRNS